MAAGSVTISYPVILHKQDNRHVTHGPTVRVALYMYSPVEKVTAPPHNHAHKKVQFLQAWL